MIGRGGEAGRDRGSNTTPRRLPAPRGRPPTYLKGCWARPGTRLALRPDHMRQNDSSLTASGAISAARLGGFLLAGLFAAAPSPAPAAEGPVAIFRDTCAACHTVGGGELVGPDLASAASMDRATLRENVIRMQDYAGELTDAQIDGLVDLLSDPRAADRIAARRPETPAAPGGERPRSRPATRSAERRCSPAGSPSPTAAFPAPPATGGPAEAARAGRRDARQEPRRRRRAARRPGSGGRRRERRVPAHARRLPGPPGHPRRGARPGRLPDGGTVRPPGDGDRRRKETVPPTSRSAPGPAGLTVVCLAAIGLGYRRRGLRPTARGGACWTEAERLRTIRRDRSPAHRSGAEEGSR